MIYVCNYMGELLQPEITKKLLLKHNKKISENLLVCIRYIYITRALCRKNSSLRNVLIKLRRKEKKRKKKHGVVLVSKR